MCIFLFFGKIKINIMRDRSLTGKNENKSQIINGFATYI